MEYICGMTYAPFARKGSYQEKSDSHAPKYFSKAMLTDYPIAGIFSSCEHEMQQQEYGYRILVHKYHHHS